jgi:beta-fructofuranosidase
LDRHPADAQATGNYPALAAKVAADPHRPHYHFLPPANWMNDPNGPIFWHGTYHLSYQYNPRGAYWGDMHWGHARSRDLVHWQHLPVALAPTPHGPDKGGCFSGSAFVNGTTPPLVYTGVEPEVQCLASSRIGMVHWQKFKGNPVLATPPRGVRDPSIWREEGGSWLMTVGSGVKGQGGTVLLYQSNDLIHWHYLRELASGPPLVARGSMIPWQRATGGNVLTFWGPCPARVNPGRGFLHNRSILQEDI